MTTTDAPPNLLTVPDDVHVLLKREAIDELCDFAAYNRAILSDVHMTYQHIERGIPLFYGLDWEIMYVYANPWSRAAFQAELVRYLIEEDTTPLTLLPGTVEEFFRFIKYAKRQAIEARSLVQSLKKEDVTDSTISCARSLCERNNLGEDAASTNVDLRRLSSALLDIASRHDTALDRLDILFNSGRLVDLISLYDETDDALFEDDLVRHFLQTLASKRSGPDYLRKNESDARNLATVVKYSERERVRWQRSKGQHTGKVLRLLTNTPSLLEMDIAVYHHDLRRLAVRSPEGLFQGIGHSLALRTVFEACYATAISRLCDNEPTRCRQLSAKQLERARMLEILATRIDNHDRDRQHIGQLERGAFEHVIEDTLPRLGEYFLGDVWYKIVRELMVANAVEAMSKQSIESGTERKVHLLDRGIAAPGIGDLDSYRTSQVEKVRFVYRKKNKKPADLLAQFGVVDREPDLLGPSAPRRWVVENAFRMNGEEIITVDKWDDDDCLYASWPCRLTEREIIAVIDLIFYVTDGLLSGTSYRGEMQAVFEEGVFSCRLSKLPLENRLTRDRYAGALTAAREANPEIPGERQVPSQIRCDTDVCAIDFDCPPGFIDPGISFGLVDESLFDVVLEVFRRTSEWGGRWKYFPQLKEVLREGMGCLLNGLEGASRERD